MRIRFCFILFLFTSTFAFGQRFDGKQTETLYRKIPRQAYNQATLDGYPLRTITDGDLIKHIGFKLFNDDLNNDLVSLFLERKILEFYTAEDYQTLNQAISVSKCELKYNGIDFYEMPGRDIKPCLQTVLTGVRFEMQKDSLYHIAVWFDNRDNYFGIKFPMNYQALTGKDKPELDAETGKELFTVEPTEMPIDVPETENLTEYGNLYVWKRSDFMIESISNSVYYNRKDDCFTPVYDPEYFVESFNNLFHQSSQYTDKIVLELEHRLYGGTKLTYNITLSKLFCYAKNNNLDVYFGVEKSEKNKIEASVILHGKEYNYIHMLHIIANKSEVFSASKGKISGMLFSNIPNDNIKTLFGDYKTGSYKELIKQLK